MCWTRPIKVQLEGTSHRQRRFNSVSLNGERARSIRKFVTSCFVQFPGLFWGIFWNVDVADVKKFVDGVCTCMHNLALERLESGSSGWCKNWALWSRPFWLGLDWPLKIHRLLITFVVMPKLIVFVSSGRGVDMTRDRCQTILCLPKGSAPLAGVNVTPKIFPLTYYRAQFAI